MTPDLQPDVNVVELLIAAVINPVTAAVAFVMGRSATEKAKILIAAFAASIAGVLVLNIAAYFHVFDASSLARASAGYFTVSLLPASIVAAIAFATKK